MVQKRNVLLHGNKPGFSFIQIVIVLSLISLIGSIAIPNIVRQQAGYEQKKFLTSINSLMSEVWQRALMSGKIEKVVFNFQARTVSVEQQKDGTDKDGSFLFEPLLLHYAQNNYTWPESFQFKQFFINGADELSARGPQGKTDTSWFFVMPSGMSQELILNIIDTAYATDDKEGKEMSFVLNPFTLQLRRYNEFQIPSS